MNEDYKQYSKNEIIRFGRVFSGIGLLILFYYIYSDVYFRKQPVWVLTRIVPITLLLFFFISSFTKNSSKKIDMLSKIHYFALFSVICMIYAQMILAWNTPLSHATMTGLMMAFIVVFLGMRGSPITLVKIYLTPSILFLIYAVTFLDNLQFLANIASSYSVMVAAICIYSSTEKLRKQLFEANKELAVMAYNDPLTMLVNRRSLWDSFAREVSRSKRNNKPFSVIMLDIDKFKFFNDKHGHDCGDFILIKLAQTLTLNIRKHDIVGRWGGEEFMILLPGINSKGAGLVAEKIRNVLEKASFRFNENLELSVTSTFGVSEYDVSKNIDDMLKKADDALYKGKQSGRNCVVVSENI